MAKEYLCLFPPPNTGFNKIYPNTSLQEADLQLATELSLTFVNRLSNKPKETAKHELAEILDRYNSRTGLPQAYLIPYLLANPFSPLHTSYKLSLPTQPREYGRWMPRAVRIIWSNLPEQRQDSYTSALSPILNSIPHTGLSAINRIFRHGCDSQFIKELQFEEPSLLGQFEHIGKILKLLHAPTITITNLAYAPHKIQLNVPAAGNTMDREYKPHSIAISIRNSTIHWKHLNQLMHLIGSEFPTLLGSVTAPWIGKPYILGANGEIC